VSGIVQGVGFRPFVHRRAGELELSGWVLNDSAGVLLEAEGDAEAVAALLRSLREDAPGLAMVEQVEARELEPSGAAGFQIRESPEGSEPDTAVSPEAATCDACLAELFDAADRRYRYPFVNCTACGPRFTIVRGVPYDRPLTTMAAFRMCEACRAEYEDPADRRFHAQPNACPRCGPRARLLSRDGSAVLPGGGEDPVAAAARALRDGSIVAVKGLGGYHLACRADDDRAVAGLRGRKHREEKPFALMVADVTAARALAEVDETAAGLMAGRERPIVLLERRAGAPVADTVAPGAPELGLMLPYSPLHHLLLSDAGTPLVMTSGNLSDEPIAYRDEDALRRLAGIADLFLTHDRPIETRTEDSVVRSLAGRTQMLRRSRGYVPAPIPLPVEARAPVLAVGAELKSTFCLVRGRRAWVGPHIGDLKDFETLLSFGEGIEHFQRLFAVEPALCAHDLHPSYLSTGYARERGGLELVGVQHHHAHLAACLAEHGLTGPALGAIYDGTGYGSDGTIWGGEIIRADLAGFERMARLWQVRLPGGDMAAHEPWRMACSWLAAAHGTEVPDLPEALDGAVEPAAWRNVARLAADGLASPLTSSAGRLFDAVAALCGIRPRVTYEGQAAVELEAACGEDELGAYPLGLIEDEGMLVLDARETILAVERDLADRVGVPRIAARFHNALAAATAEACERCAGGELPVVLSGGVFQNRRLLESTSAVLRDREIEAIVPELLPPNDGGISYGQAAVAAARSAFEPGGKGSQSR
jgi:hydrogenase maturation protein HypF